MDKILEVKNLKVSFRTQGGTVKAVRDISFDLERGKTLAIVGESGSGKSVTSKAILGILAGNSIIEGGEILYDGKDLLSITEDEMYKIRGDKISMIFQDPLSSLNPIVKIGRQITEAMLLKNKANRKEARNEFNSLLRILKSNMIAAQGQGSEAEITEMIKTFDGFATLSTKLEMPYNDAMANAEEIKASVEDLLFMVEKKQNPDVREKLTDYVLMLQKVQNEFIEDEYAARLTELLDNYKKEKDSYPKKVQENVELSASLEKLLNDTAGLMEDIISQPRPNFFRIGYYKLKGKDCSIKGKGVEKLNEEALTFLNDNFMNHFLERLRLRAMQRLLPIWFRLPLTSLKLTRTVLHIPSEAVLIRLSISTSPPRRPIRRRRQDLQSSLPRERSLSQRERLWTGRLYRSQFMTLMS